MEPLNSRVFLFDWGLLPAASSDGVIPSANSIEDSHEPDVREFDVKHGMSVIEYIFRHAASTLPTMSCLDSVIISECKAHDDLINFLPVELCYSIQMISRELTCKCWGGNDLKERTLTLIKGPILSPYPWERKAVLVLAAIVMIYGEFLLSLCAENSLAKSLALLKQMRPELLQHVDALYPLNNLIEEMVKLVTTVIEFSDLHIDCVMAEEDAMVEYQDFTQYVVRYITDCAMISSDYIFDMIVSHHEYLASKYERLSSLSTNVNKAHDVLKKYLMEWRHEIENSGYMTWLLDGKNPTKAYKIIEQLFNQNGNGSCTQIMKNIFPCPFIQGSLDKKVHVASMHQKTVLLLFSGLQITEEDRLTFRALEKIHVSRDKEKNFEVVWVPIMDPISDHDHKDRETTILNVARKMPWLTAYPALEPNYAFLRYVRKEWRFSKKAIVVALDKEGRVTNRNALHMINIWGAEAYPFSTQREESLWEAEKWRLQFVVKDIDATVSSWISQNKQICLYGGEDIDSIKSFTTKMKEVMKATGEKIEMVYVGKANPGAPIKKIIDMVETHKLYFESISIFWMRLESMLHSRMQIQKDTTVDTIYQEVTNLFSYDNSSSGCRLLARGNQEMFVNEGRTFIRVLKKHDKWKHNITENGFVSAFQTGYQTNKQMIDKKNLKESYTEFEQVFKLTVHVDDMKILRTIFPFPLIQGSLSKKVYVESLRQKIVLLLFSDVQITEEDRLTFRALKNIHANQSQDKAFEVVWIPISDLHYHNFEEAILKEAGEMPWLTAYLTPCPQYSAFVKYVRKEWRFNKKAMLVALDDQGRVTNSNALHMINIWGSQAYPFSTQKEELLWEAESWGLQFVVKDIDATVSSWVSQNKQICLYGGEDIASIKSFTTKMKHVMKATGEEIEMVYVGKANPGAHIENIINMVETHKLLFESISIFWMRLESMLHSQMQIRKGTKANMIQQEVISLLTYGNSSRGCSLLAKGSHKMFVNESSTFIRVLENHDSWKHKVAENGFVTAFENGYRMLMPERHCFTLVLSSSSSVHCIACPGCGNNMKKSFLFQCCHTQLVPDLVAAPDANPVIPATAPCLLTTRGASPTPAHAPPPFLIKLP